MDRVFQNLGALWALYTWLLEYMFTNEKAGVYCTSTADHSIVYGTTAGMGSSSPKDVDVLECKDSPHSDRHILHVSWTILGKRKALAAWH